jgi:1,4-dihydroxy-2-naphthoate octaprenyltransferase
LAIFANFGLLPASGTSIVTTGVLTWDSLWFLLLFIPITNAVLHANNTRDVFTDSRANIKTMPMLLGKKMCQIIYYIEVFLPSIWTIVCVCVGVLPPYALLVLISLKMVINNCRDMKRYTEDNHAIDHLDEKTAQLQTISSGLIILTTAITMLVEKLF